MEEKYLQNNMEENEFVMFKIGLHQKLKKCKDTSNHIRKLTY